MSDMDQPMQRNPLSGEFFLPLRRHSNLVVTPPRASDATAIRAYLSDPRIYEGLVSPPVPYLLEHAEKLLSRVMPFSLATVEEMEGGAAVLSGSCPFMMIRKSIASGGDELIGNIMFKPSEGRYDHLRELEEIGDSTDIWTIGDWLAPEHQGQGIMSDAIETILHDWVVPRMAVKKVVVSAFVDNRASIRTFEKNGFKSISVIPDRTLVVRGRPKEFHTLVWNAPLRNILGLEK